MLLFFLIFIVGFLVVSCIVQSSNIFERLFLGMPIGLGLTTMLLFLYNSIFGSYSLTSVFIMVILLLLVSGAYFFLRVYSKERFQKLFKLDFSQVNLWVLAFLGIVAYLVWGISTKNLFFPVTSTDAVMGYDLLAKAIANEGTLFNSVLLDEDLVKGCGPRLMYPPLAPYSFSLAHMLDFESSKILTTFFYVSYVGAFLVLLTKISNLTSAMFFTFFVVIIPEMFAHGSFALTNIPASAYAILSVVCILIWHQKKDVSYLVLATLLSSLMLWTRNDTIFVFVGIQLAILFLMLRKKNFKYNLIYAASILPFIVWAIASKMMIPKELDSIFVDHLFYDSEKLNKLLDRCYTILTSKTLYGISFNLFIVVLLAHIVAIFKRKDNWFLLTILFSSLIGYTLIFYQISDENGFLFAANGGWLDSGYKRGLFTYVPLFFVYMSQSEYVKKGFDFIHRKLIKG